MELSEFVHALQLRPEYHERVVHVEHVAPQMALWAEPQQPLPPVLQRALDARGITGLYTCLLYTSDAADE